ncbi:hypothetical protein B0H12DRAFT_1078412 [Mycena haematopus]|nr:hypothetical protein B0H12DRAFT_1078412 [Mycena haematopus]
MSSDSDSMPDFKKLKDAIDTRHLDSFKDFKLVADPTEPAPRAAFNDLTSWTKDLKFGDQLQQRVHGFHGECGNVSKRLWKHTAVAKTPRRTLAFSIAPRVRFPPLFAVGALLKFVFDDLVSKHPDGHSLLVGPFCGAFIPKDFINNPFIGVAFKLASACQCPLLPDTPNTALALGACREVGTSLSSPSVEFSSQHHGHLCVTIFL